MKGLFTREGAGLKGALPHGKVHEEGALVAPSLKVTRTPRLSELAAWQKLWPSAEGHSHTNLWVGTLPPPFSGTPFIPNPTKRQREGQPPRAQSRENDGGAQMWRGEMENIQHTH